MNWRSQAGKSSLIKMLMQKHGFSKRKAERGVNGVFACMARALARGEKVELPVGWMQAVSPPPGHKSRVRQRFRNIRTGKIFYRIARHPNRIIRFRPNPKLIEKGAFPPPPSSKRLEKGEELDQLLAQLGFPDFTLPDVKSLLAAADADLDRLLARLRLLAREGRKFSNFHILRDTVRQMYWISR
jgi:nucleoid DNA-binding protein